MTEEKNIIIAPSILSADFAMLMPDIRKVHEAEYLHVDVMDGHFVPEITIGPGMVRAIRSHLNEEGSKQRLDVHLMIENPERQVEKFILAGADIVTVHAEATHHLQRLLAQISDLNVLAGVAINPGTPLSLIEEVIPDMDLLLIMTVNPGYGGQKFIPSMLGKIHRAASMLKENNPNAILEVDGGVNMKNSRIIVESGADMLVAGSAIFTGEPEQNLIDLTKAAAGSTLE